MKRCVLARTVCALLAISACGRVGYGPTDAGREIDATVDASTRDAPGPLPLDGSIVPIDAAIDASFDAPADPPAEPVRVTRGIAGAEPDGDVAEVSVDDRGEVIAVTSYARNMTMESASLPVGADRSVFVFVGGEVFMAASPRGEIPNGPSYNPDVSADGRFVAFASAASNLVPSDTNARDDVFVLDVVAQTVERVSVSSTGTQGNGNSGYDTGGFNTMRTSISADGRVIVFASVASNLVPGDTNGEADVFLHDRVGGTTIRVSESLGVQGNGFSLGAECNRDASMVVFRSRASNFVVGDSNDTDDVFLWQRGGAALLRVSIRTDGRQANGPSYNPVITDSDHIVYSSDAPNLVDGDTNGSRDVFRFDLTTTTTTRVSEYLGAQLDTDADFLVRASPDGRRTWFLTSSRALMPSSTPTARKLFGIDREASTIAEASCTTMGLGCIGDVTFFDYARTTNLLALVTSSVLADGTDTNGRSDVYLVGATP